MSNFNILFTTKAEADLEEIRLYYSNISVSVTRNFFKAFFENINFIKQTPTIFQERYRKIRIAPFYKFPYGIHYKIKDNTIIIYRVLHTKRYFKQ